MLESKINKTIEKDRYIHKDDLIEFLNISSFGLMTQEFIDSKNHELIHNAILTEYHEKNTEKIDMDFFTVI